MKRREDLKVDIYILLGKIPTSWKSQLQKNVTLSTAEAEFVSLTECTKQALWFKNLFKEIFNQVIKFKIMVDNKACIVIAQDTNSKGRCKHIDLRYKFIQEEIMKNEIELEYINTENILADPLTKSIRSTNDKIYKFNFQRIIFL